MVATLANKADASQLAQCEEVIERGLDSFIEVGNALLQIREGRLYREDYDNFETYCQERWEMCGRRARQLMDSAIAISNLKVEPMVPIPDSERVVRPLTSLPAPLQRDVWTSAVTTAKKPGKPTAAEVRAAVVKAIPEVHTKTVTVRLNGTIVNSPALRELKRAWKRAGLQDRTAFRKWIGEQP